MVRKRVPETDQGIQDEFNVELFNQFAQHMRNKGWIETKSILTAGICSGNVLEIGPGPGIKGLEWLKNTSDTKLIGLEISEAMVRIAQVNAREYALEHRVQYVHGNATLKIPFDDVSFDAVFSNGSLHEWEYPEKVLNEIYRVLKPGGKMYISDLRRDMNPLMKLIIKKTTYPKQMVPGFISSLDASYTVKEIKNIVENTLIENFTIRKDPVGLSIIVNK